MIDLSDSTKTELRGQLKPLTDKYLKVREELKSILAAVSFLETVLDIPEGERLKTVKVPRRS